MKNNTDELLTLRHVTAGYGHRRVVHDLSARIRPGDFIVLHGSNGCGKSTLLRLMAGLLCPDGGTVWRREGLQTGYLPQHRAVDRTFPITVRQVVLSGLTGQYRWWRSCPAELCHRADDLLVRLGLEACATHPIEALSGGQWQRTLLARALVSRPDLLLLDEPETHLDAAMRALLYDLLRDGGAARAVVMVSHEEDTAALPPGYTLWRMQEGRLLRTV